MPMTVPTPQEIAEMIRRRDAGLPPKIALAEDVKAISNQTLNTAGRVAQLEQQLKKKKLSGVELADKVQAVFAANKFSAVEELVKLVCQRAADGSGVYELDRIGEFKTRVHILETLLEYEAPKLKSVEVKGQVEHNHNITIVRFGEDGTISREKPKKAINVVTTVEQLEESTG